MILKLITVPNDQLRIKSQPVKNLDKKTVHLISDLAETLVKKKNPGGVGLSAIQVGKNLRVFCTYLPPKLDLEHDDQSPIKPELKVFINPEIIDQSDNLTFGPDPKHPILEGCLSVPALYGPVPRRHTVKVRYQTLPIIHSSNLPDLIEKTDVFSNFFARVIQHEYDHLEGVLFTDYIKQDHQELYFDDGDKLVLIPKPKELVRW